MSPGTGFSYVLIFFLGCIDYYFHYRFVTYINKDLTIKQKAHIMSIKSSLTLFLLGIYFNYYYFTSGFSQDKFYTFLEKTDSLNFAKLIVLYFSAFLLTEIWIGNKEYPEYMTSISGNFHHTIYIGVNLIALYTGLYPLYLLHMMSEFPTFVMSLGSFDNELRNDNLFGITFFITRIVYHLILTVVFRHKKILLGLSLASLSLHIYWFYGWWKKYGSKLFKKNNIKDCSKYYQKKSKKNKQLSTEVCKKSTKNKSKVQLKKKQN